MKLNIIMDNGGVIVDDVMLLYSYSVKTYKGVGFNINRTSFKSHSHS